MAATPLRAAKAEAALVGQPWDAASVARAAAALDEDFSPIDDHRSSAWFRATVARNLQVGFFEETATERTPALPDRPSATVLV